MIKLNANFRSPSFLMGFLLFGLAPLMVLGCSPNNAHYKSGEGPDITRWALPDADIVSVLSEEPNECLSDTPNGQEIMGRLAFRSPFLLGGQAARRGLTCQACHGQGQVNSHFFVIGLSETPGTADVTSFHFSDELGDESFNPVPIPSLADDIEGVDFDPNLPDLDKFVTRLITKEFTGPEPSPEVQGALLAYLRGLTAQPCSSPTLKETELLAYKRRIIDQSFHTLQTSTLSKNTFDFMTAALRIELGRLHIRFPNHPQLQEELASLSQSLRSLGSEPRSFEDAYSAWVDLARQLEPAYEGSLFHPDTIRAWEAARRDY